MSVPTLQLPNAQRMPVIGLGTYKSGPGQVETAVKVAVEAGYRHIDCAPMYNNECEIGAAIREKILDGTVKREDLFITTKLWNTYHKKEMVVPALKKSLQSLGLDYVDLYLIHWPYAFKEGEELLPRQNNIMQYSDVDYLETWESMEDCIRLGLAKNIGVSNFNSEQLSRIMDNCNVPPSVNQVECNPTLNQKPLREYCKDRGITVVGYCPLGRPGQTGNQGKPESAVSDDRVRDIAAKYAKSPAQIVLRYLIHLGIAVIPKSVTPSRIKENLDIFDFELVDEEIAYMDTLNQNIRICPSTEFKDHKYYPFHIEY